MSQSPTAFDAARQPLLSWPDGSTDQDTPRPNGTATPEGPSAFPRTLTTASAATILLTICIGSGVFTSPGSIDSNVPSPGAALAVWLVGGALAWGGAVTMAEFGTAFPDETGGLQAYLVRAWFGAETLGFLAAWTWVVAVMPATLAILAIVLVESVGVAVGWEGGGEGSEWARKGGAVAVLVVVCSANCVSTRVTTRLNGLFVGAKFASVAAVFVAGVAVAAVQIAHPDRTDVGGRDWFTRPWFRPRDTVDPDGSVVRWGEMGAWDVMGRLSTALYGALWAYSGWDKVRLSV